MVSHLQDGEFAALAGYRQWVDNILRHPRIYEWKTSLVSFGRSSVQGYVQSQLGVVQDGRVLDLGCATGRYAHLFQGAYIGTDINAAYVEYGSRRYEGRFTVMDGRTLAFQSCSFDATLCVGVLHHLDDRSARCILEEMKRVTKPAGEVLVIDAIAADRHTRLLGKLDRGAHVRTFSQQQTLLNEAGYRLLTGSVPNSFPYRRAAFSFSSRKPNPCA